MSLTILDVVVLVIVGLSTIVALARGVVREFLSLLAWVGAIAVAWFAFVPARALVLDAVGNELAADLGTAALVFLVPLIVFKIIGGMIGRAVDGSGLGSIDRILGVAFGVARGALIVSAAYLVGTMLIEDQARPGWIERAFLKPQLEQGADLLRRALPETFDARVAREKTAFVVESASELRGDPPRQPTSSADGGEPGYRDRAIEQMNELLGGILGDGGE